MLNERILNKEIDKVFSECWVDSNQLSDWVHDLVLKIITLLIAQDRKSRTMTIEELIDGTNFELTEHSYSCTVDDISLILGKIKDILKTNAADTNTG